MRLHDPATGQKLLTSWESLSVTEAALRKAEAEKRQAEAEKRQAEQERLLMAKALSEAKAAQLAAQADRERIQRKVPPALKCGGFPALTFPRGEDSESRASSGRLTAFASC